MKKIRPFLPNWCSNQFYISSQKNNDEEFPKENNKTTTMAQFLPFFPFFLSMFQQKQNTNSCFQRECGQNNWMNHIKYYQTNEREIEHVRFAAWRVFTKTPKRKKNTKKTFDKLSFTKIIKDIQVKSQRLVWSKFQIKNSHKHGFSWKGSTPPIVTSLRKQFLALKYIRAPSPKTKKNGSLL